MTQDPHAAAAAKAAISGYVVAAHSSNIVCCCRGPLFQWMPNSLFILLRVATFPPYQFAHYAHHQRHPPPRSHVGSPLSLTPLPSLIKRAATAATVATVATAAAPLNRASCMITS
eukprot:6208449-Pleurochrysis_carterae.AAC.1